MSRLWKYKPVDSQRVDSVAEATCLSPLMARLLVLRGWDTPEAIEACLQPRLSDLSDPFLLPDLESAAARIWSAIDEGERIVVFGDYDVDGVTSAALMVRVLHALGGDVQPFIPDRLDEGYGLTREAFERCVVSLQPQLLVTVDCGSNSVESVERARALGIDVIVTDHHELEECIAPAYAVVNPKRGEVADLSALAGVGVAFKLCHGLLKLGRDAGRIEADSVDLRHYLDLVALGTVTDMVPLTGENRLLVHGGVKTLETTRWEGMRALKEVSGIRGTVETYHLGFQLGPRINAAGRIGQPMQALRLLTTSDRGEAREIAERLELRNQERRRMEQDLAEQAYAQIDADYDPERDYGLVVALEDAHPGVVGIVASRVSRHYNRPAIVLGIDPSGVVRGSCRSIEGFDLLEGLRACERYLTRFGGHTMAAGVGVEPGKVDLFRQAFNAVAKKILEGQDLRPAILIDADVVPEQIDWTFHQELTQLQPHGQDNPEPILALRDVELVGKAVVVGRDHLKMKLRRGEAVLEAIAFNYALEDLPEGPLDVAFVLKVNSWNGHRSLQLQVRDIRSALGSA